MESLIPVTVANGDGIGPEIMHAVLEIIRATKAPLDIKTVEIGEKVYLTRIPRRHRTFHMGNDPQKQRIPQSAYHHSPRRRL